MKNRAAIIGASYAGLSAAAALRAKGWETIVVEKSTSLSRSGGGVVVQKQMADYLEENGIAYPRITAVPAVMRMMYQRDGTVLHLPETAVAYTAWDILLKEIEQTVGSNRIRRGSECIRIEQDSRGAAIHLADGSSIDADLIVAADGIGSPARRFFLPDEQPEYAGYVAWRGMVDEAEIPQETIDTCSGSLCSYVGDATNILAYETPGSDGSTVPGHRRINWVWYRNVAPGGPLDELLTDASGLRRSATVPRGLVPRRTESEIRLTAQELLPTPFSTVVEATKEPFVQAIFDYQASRTVFDRAVLIGDAACLVRPHIGSGTAKAVDDAIQLAHAVTGPDYRERECLQSWQARRRETHYGLMEQSKALARRMGLGVT